MNRFLKIVLRCLQWILGVGLSTSVALSWTPTQAPPWTDGTQTLHIGLDAQDRYVDGNTAASSFQEAIALWNNRIQRFQMDSVLTTRTTAARGDGVNHVVMASTVYGTEFGTNVLAVAAYFGTAQSRMETDIIFNSKWNWSSYRGSLQSGIPDLQRVALHELGHFLGLGHPDEDGQRVSAVMNSSIGHTHQLTPDDRIGGAVLYGLRGSNEGLLPVVHSIFSVPQIMPMDYGDTVRFQPYVTVPGTASYRWFKDGNPIDGASQPTYSILSVTTEDQGAYSVAVSNELGSAHSSSLPLTTNPPLAPEFFASAPSDPPSEGYPFSLGAYIYRGAFPVSITLKRDGIVVAEYLLKKGVPSFTWSPIANIQHTGRYTIHMANAGGAVVSDPIPIVVKPLVKPRLLIQQADISVGLGETFVFDPEFTGDYYTTTVHWKKDGVPISSGNRLVISSFGPEHVGVYTYTVSNSKGSVEQSFVVKLLPLVAPSFRYLPTDRGFYGSLHLYSEAIGSQPLTYQWSLNGKPVGASSESKYYNVPAAGPEHAGNYTVTVSNPAGSITSPPARLTHDPSLAPQTAPPRISKHPGSLEVKPGGKANFLFETQSTTGMQYQWYKDGILIAGKNSSTLQINPVSAEDAGAYHAIAYTAQDTLTSQPARLTVSSNINNIFETLPGDGYVLWESNYYVHLDVNAESQESAIKWYRVGFPAPLDQVGASLWLNALTKADEGDYYAEVTLGTQVVVTPPFRIRVIPPPVPPSLPLESKIVVAGSHAVLSAPSATGTITSYQWKKNGVEIPGAIFGSLDFPQVSFDDAGLYSVVRTNPSGSGETIAGRLTVVQGTPPVFRMEPTLIWSGNTANVRYQTESETQVSFLWKKNGTPISSYYPFSEITDFSGVYTLTATNASGSVESKPVEFIDQRNHSDRYFLAEPQSQTVTLGSHINLYAISVSPYDSFIWKKNGASLGQDEFGLLTLENLTPEKSGRYSVALQSNGSMIQESAVADLRVLPYGRLFNLSSRSLSGGDNATLIAGFTVSGPIPKQVLIRGIGPALAAFGVNDALEDPKLTLYNTAGQKIAEVDSLDLSKQAEVEGVARRMGAFALDPHGKDAPLLITLEPGGYTAHLTAASGPTTGVALLEVYDCFKDASRLVNLSTRTRVSPGSGTLISGFIVEPGAPKKVLIRAAGPALDTYGVADTLSDPELEIIAMTDPQQTVAKNDDWDSTDVAQVERAASSVGAFSFKRGSRDAAVVATLPPGAYTALVSGKNDTSGVALVEVYEIVD